MNGVNLLGYPGWQLVEDILVIKFSMSTSDIFEKKNNKVLNYFTKFQLNINFNTVADRCMHNIFQNHQSKLKTGRGASFSLV